MLCLFVYGCSTGCILLYNIWRFNLHVYSSYHQLKFKFFRAILSILYFYACMLLFILISRQLLKLLSRTVHLCTKIIWTKLSRCILWKQEMYYMQWAFFFCFNLCSYLLFFTSTFAIIIPYSARLYQDNLYKVIMVYCESKKCTTICMCVVSIYIIFIILSYRH